MTKFAVMDSNMDEIHSIELNINDMPSSDPLAFAYGISMGQHYAKLEATKKPFKIDHGSKHSELAQEYLRGFLMGFRGILIPEGTKIKKGQEQNYFHSDKNILK